MPNKLYDEITALERLEKASKTTSTAIKSVKRDIRELNEAYGTSLSFGGKRDYGIESELRNLQGRLTELQRLRDNINRGLRSPIGTGNPKYVTYSTEQNPLLKTSALDNARKYRDVSSETNKLIAQRQSLYKDELISLKQLQKGTSEIAAYAGARRAGMEPNAAVIAARKAGAFLKQTGVQETYASGVGGGPSGKTAEGLNKFDIFLKGKGSDDRVKTIKLSFDEIGNILGKANGLAEGLNTKFGQAKKPLSEAATQAMGIIDALESSSSKTEVLRKRLHQLNMEFLNLNKLQTAQALEAKQNWGGKVPPAGGPPPPMSTGYAAYQMMRGEGLNKLAAVTMGRKFEAFTAGYGATDMSQVEKLKVSKAGFSKEGDQVYQFTAKLKEADGSMKTVNIKMTELGQVIGRVNQVLNTLHPKIQQWMLDEDMRRRSAGVPAGGTTNIPHPAGKDVEDTPPPPPPGGGDDDAKKKAKQAFEQAQLEALQQKYGPAFDYARQFGMGPGNLKKVFEQQGGVGNTGFMFQQKDPITGAMRSLNVTMDQFGRLVPEVSRRFRTFTQGVLRDVRELAKWTIAIGLIYGPLNKIQQLMSDMVLQESKLADATIAVNNSMVKQADIFNAVYDSAQQAGESVTGVIDAFVLAYRATGGAATETERFSIAQKLLNDSLTLSKLSGMGQADAIDTLAAALRQVGSSLTGTGDVLERGTQLLDKWVRVTKVANVDLMTLATGFSVLGETAESAGMGIDELNATIAVIAESTPYSGREAANSVRYMLGGYQSGTAITELNKYGISVTDSTGKVREFLDVMQELYQMKTAGVIDKEAFSEISNALGGGPRGAARFQAFIDSFGRIAQIRQASFEASGDAAEAMAMKLETVQTAITRLQNAALGLAQALGDQGGLLTIFKGLVDFGTMLVVVLDKVVSLTGKATPALLALGIAAALIGKTDAQSRGLMVQSVGQKIANIARPTTIKPGSTFRSIDATPEELAMWDRNQSLQKKATGFLSSKAIGIIGGVALAGTTAAFNASQGNQKQAVGNLVGGVLGTALGALGGPATALIGSALGSAIAEAFVNATMTYKSEFSSFFAESYKNAVTVGGPATTTGKTAGDVEKEIFASAGGQFAVFMSLFKEADKTTLGIVEQYKELRKQGFEVQGGKIQQTLADWAVPGTYALRGPKGEQATVKMPGMYEEAYLKAMEMSGAETQAAARAFTAKQMAEQGIYSEDYSPLVKRQQVLLSGNETEIERLATQKREDLMKQMIRGDITSSEFGKKTEWLKGAPQISTRWMAAFGEEFMAVADDIDNTSDAWKAFIDILASGSEEGIQYLNATLEQINAIESQLAQLEGENIEIDVTINGEKVTLKGRGKIEDYLGVLRQQGGAMTANINAQQSLNQVKMLGIAGSPTQATARADYDKIIERATQLQEEYADAVEMTTDQYDLWTSQMEGFMVLTEEAGKIQYTTAKKLEERWYSAAEAELIDKGAIKDATKGMGFQTYDFTQAQIRAAEAQAKVIAQQWSTTYGYKPDIESQIAVAKDGTMQVTTDLQIMQMLLQRLVDINQKQLDGMYNLPEGATFWVPITAAYYRHQGGGGGGLSAPLEGSGTGQEDVVTTSPERKLRDTIDLGRKVRMDDYEDFPKFKLLPADKGGIPHARLTSPLQQQQADLAKDSTLERILGAFERFLGIFGFAGRTAAAGELPPFPAPSAGGGPLGAGIGGVGLGGAGSRSGVRGGVPQTNVNTAPAAKINLNLKSTTTLLVDGRVLASVIKQYLANDLIKTTSSYGTSSKNYIV